MYCVGDSCFPGQDVNAVAFSGVMCAHRVAADLGLCMHCILLEILVASIHIRTSFTQIFIGAGLERRSEILDKGLLGLLSWFRTLA